MSIYKEIMALPCHYHSNVALIDAWFTGIEQAADLASAREREFIEQECLMADRLENLESHYAYSVQAHAKLLGEREAMIAELLELRRFDCFIEHSIDGTPETEMQGEEDGRYCSHRHIEQIIKKYEVRK